MTGTRSLVHRILAVAAASLALAVLPGGSADAQGVSPIVIRATGELEQVPCSGTCTGTLDGQVVETFHFVDGNGPATANVAWALADLDSTFDYSIDSSVGGGCPPLSVSGSGTAFLDGGTVAGVVTTATTHHVVTSVDAEYNYTFASAGPLVVIEGSGGGQINIRAGADHFIAHFGPSAGVGVLTTSTVPLCDGAPLSFTLTGAIAAVV